MARTAPVPNFPAIPGMNPGLFVLGGGGDGAGSGAGKGGAGKGKQGAGGNNKDKDATGGGKSAQGASACGGCGGPHASGVRGDPVDVVTGRVTTVSVDDFVLPGPLELRFSRRYCSHARDHDFGIGFGWGHTFGWAIEVRRRTLRVWDEEATFEDFQMPDDGEELIGPRGWVVRRSGDTFEIDSNDDRIRSFAPSPGDPSPRLRSVRDPNGNTVEVEWRGDKIASVKDSAGRTLFFNGSPESGILSLVVSLPSEGDRRAKMLALAYDGHQNLVRATDADGFEHRYAYADDHLLARYRNRRGVVFHYVYDSAWRCVETWGRFEDRDDPSVIAPATLADQQTPLKGVFHHKFLFGADGFSEVAGCFTVEQFQGAPDGRIERSTHGGAVASRVYDDHGYLKAIADGTGAVTAFERDARGRLLKATDPLGRVTSAVRDAGGRVVEVTTPEGGVSRTEYDARGNVRAHTEPDGSTTQYEYDARGLLTRRIDPDGAVSEARYDDEGNWIELRTPNGSVWRRTFDGLGRKMSETDPTGATRHFSYTARGDLREVRDAAGGVTTFTYDGERAITSEVDPTGARMEITYGAHGRPARLLQRDGGVFELRYAADGTLLQIVNERGEQAELAWDTRWNLISETGFDNRTLRFWYDAGNRVIRARRPSGEDFGFEYDDAGQLLKRVLPDGTAEEMDYDAEGRVVAARNSETEVLFVRDSRGRIVREVQRACGVSVTVDTSYAATGELIARRSSLGHQEELTWNECGRLVERRVGGRAVVRRTLDDRLLEAKRELSDGGQVQTAWDPEGRLAAVRVTSAAGVTAERRIQTDPRGAVSLAWDSRLGGTRYERDAQGRLTRVTAQSGRDEKYLFDPAGNVFEAGGTRSYDAGGRLAECNGTVFRYDDNGKLVEKTAPGAPDPWRYEWTAAGRLAAVVRPDGARITYVYDVFGRRLQKVGPDGTVRYVWEGDDLLHEVRGTKAEPEIRTYLFAPDTWIPVAHRDGTPGDTGGSGWLHYVTDDVGTPVWLVSADGAQVTPIERSAWGRPLGASPTPISLLGQYLDEDTGLVYNRFRYFDPQTSRYISADPLGIEGGANPYGYPHDPTRFVDPLALRFPDKVKEQALQANRDKNGGVVKCEECGIECVKPKKSMKGDTADKRPDMLKEWQFDHIHPESKGGKDTLDNCQVLCRSCNRSKSNKN